MVRRFPSLPATPFHLTSPHAPTKGQTGSGKSYSMVGYGRNKGIVPIACDEIFKQIAANTDPKFEFRVSLQMLEIYNEQVRDLQVKTNPKGGLKVRQHPKLGVQVAGLKVSGSGEGERGTRLMLTPCSSGCRRPVLQRD